MLDKPLEYYFKNGIPEKHLVENVKPKYKDSSNLRWAIVSENFCQGCNVSIALCKHYGLDPEERIEKLGYIVQEKGK